MLTQDQTRFSSPEQMLYAMVNDRWRAAAIGVVARLGIAELLANGPLHVSEVARATKSDEGTLYRVLRALAREKVFAESPRETFVLTPLSRCLLPDARNSLLNIVLHATSEREHQLWGSLEYSVRTGQAAQAHVFGMGAWEYFDQHPNEGAWFHNGMAELTRQIAPILAASYDFGRFKSVIDVGGGRGQLISAILSRHPSLRGAIHDLGQAMSEADALLRNEGVRERVVELSDSTKSQVPIGYDAYVMKNVMHGVGGAALDGILAGVRSAMARETRLLVIEHVIPETGPYLQYLDLEVLLAGGDMGRERTRVEFERDLGKHGLVISQIFETPTPFSIIEACIG